MPNIDNPQITHYVGDGCVPEHTMPTAKKKKISSKLAVKLCDHDFKYSHIEHPPFGTYGSYIPPDKEVVVCRNCGQIIKTFVI